MKYEIIKSIVHNTFLPAFDINILIDNCSNNNTEDIIKEWNSRLAKSNISHSTMEFKIGVHPFEDFVKDGLVVNFTGSDTEELFVENLKTQPENWYYRHHEVKYTLNSLGYRTKQFDNIDWENSIVMFGCSFVYGFGVTDEHTIPYFLEQLSGRPVINMGIGGSSIQTIFHNSIILNDSKYPTPKAVVTILPTLSRYLKYEDICSQNYGFWNDISSKSLTSIDHVTNNILLIKTIRNLWKTKTYYYEYTWARESTDLINKLDDSFCCGYLNTECRLARDLSHCGPETNLKLATEIYENIKSNI